MLAKIFLGLLGYSLGFQMSSLHQKEKEKSQLTLADGSV